MSEPLTPLQQRMQERQNQASQIEQEALENFKNELTKSLKNVEQTMSNAIASSQKALLVQKEKDFEMMQSRIHTLTYKLLLMPLLLLLLLTGLAIAGIWTFNKMTEPWTSKTMTLGDNTQAQFQVIESGGWGLCNMGTQSKPITKPCRRAP